MATPNPASQIDLEAAERLVAQLERDLAQARSASADAGHIARVRADVEQLRNALDTQPAHADVHAGLHALRDTLHAVREELQRDAITASDYLTRIGRLLGF